MFAYRHFEESERICRRPRRAAGSTCLEKVYAIHFKSSPRISSDAIYFSRREFGDEIKAEMRLRK